MKIKRNKKGDIEASGIFWLFVNFVFVGIFIALGVWIIYPSNFDSRGYEARILSDKLAAAVSQNGYFNQLALEKDFNIIGSSGLDPNQFFNGGKFYFNVTILKDGRIVNSFENGTKDFRVHCSISGDKLAKCYYKDFYVIDRLNPGQFYRIKILAASNQQGGEIRK